MSYSPELEQVPVFMASHRSHHSKSCHLHPLHRNASNRLLAISLKRPHLNPCALPTFQNSLPSWPNWACDWSSSNPLAISMGGLPMQSRPRDRQALLCYGQGSWIRVVIRIHVKGILSSKAAESIACAELFPSESQFRTHKHQQKCYHPHSKDHAV